MQHNIAASQNNITKAGMFKKQDTTSGDCKRLGQRKIKISKLILYCLKFALSLRSFF
jgi:hypothetical protein